MGFRPATKPRILLASIKSLFQAPTCHCRQGGFPKGDVAVGNEGQILSDVELRGAIEARNGIRKQAGLPQLMPSTNWIVRSNSKKGWNSKGRCNHPSGIG
jgi:hypothetical protein